MVFWGKFKPAFLESSCFNMLFFCNCFSYLPTWPCCHAQEVFPDLLHDCWEGALWASENLGHVLEGHILIISKHIDSSENWVPPFFGFTIIYPHFPLKHCHLTVQYIPLSEMPIYHLPRAQRCAAVSPSLDFQSYYVMFFQRCFNHCCCCPKLPSRISARLSRNTHTRIYIYIEIDTV